MLRKKTGLLFLTLMTALSMLFGVSCSDSLSPSRPKEIIGQLQEPVELWLCNYEQYDLYVAAQGEFLENHANYEFNKGWILVPKRSTNKEYSCVDVTQVFYPYPAGTNPMSPGSKTSKYGIGGTALTAFVRTETGFYTPEGYSSYEAFANDAYATLCIPEIAAQPALTDAGKAPFTVEYTVNPSEDSLGRLCPNGNRRVMSMPVSTRWDSSMTKPFGSGEWGDSGDGERFRFNFRNGISSEAPPNYDEYGYDVKSPVPVEVRKIVREKIIPRAPVEGGQLELALKKWKGQLTPKQALVLQTLIELGKAFDLAATQAIDSAKAITERLKSVTAGAIQAVKDVAVCLAKVGAAGEYSDWYEVVVGKDFCDGSDLTIPGRAITALGIVGGQGKFWRAVGETFGVTTTIAKVGKKASELVDQFAPKFIKLSAKEAEETLGEIAKQARKDGLGFEEDIDAILHEVEQVLEAGGCSPFLASNFDQPSILDKVFGLVEGTAYAASCTTTQAKKLAVDEFKKNTSYRKNFLAFTKKTREEMKGFDCHHTLPQKFRPFFTKLKIKIDESKYLSWWEKSPHRSAAKSVNKAWEDWIAANPDATADKAIEFGRKLALEANLTIYY